MAKSDLMALLRRQLRLAAYGVKHDISTPELIERDEAALFHQARQWSRREFLQKSAVAVGGAAFLASLDRASIIRAQARKVVVVGAGLAGTIAAYRLQQAKANVELYEASKRVGGRVFTQRSFYANSQMAELGGELVDSNHVTLQALLQEFGGTLADLKKVDEKFEKDTYFFKGAKVTPAEIIEGFRPVAEAMIGDLRALTDPEGDISYTSGNNAELLDNLSIAEWLDKRGISGTIRDLLATAYTAEYGMELDQQSALNLLWFISTDLGETGDQFEIFGESDERFRIREGSDNLPRKIGARLRKPPTFESVLEAIKEKSGGGYVLTFSIKGVAKDVEADDVVLAIPFTMLRNVDIQVELPPLKRKAIDELGYGTNTKLMLGFGTQVWRKAGFNGSVYSDLPFQTTWETSRGQGNTNGILTSFSGGNGADAIGAMDEKEAANAFLEQYAQLLPGIKSAYTGKHSRFAWGGYEFTKGGYAGYRPGQYTSLRGVEAEPVGRIFFAGEHTSLNFQGFMEGAVESAERVAKEVIGV
jgi:monoamine oxidase